MRAGHAEIDGSTEYEYTQSLTTDAVTIPNDEDLAATNTLDQLVRLLKCFPTSLLRRLGCLMLHR